MAEAAAVLSLAANVLQVLDYGTTFAHTAWNIWKSGRGAVVEFTTLESLSENLANIATQLRPTAPAHSHHEPHVTSDRGIFEAAEECAMVAQQILDSLESIGLRGGANNNTRKRDALSTAFMVVWKSDDIKAMETRLASVRSQLTLNLAASIRVYAMQSLERQDAILKQLLEMRAESSGRVSQWTGNETMQQNTKVGFGHTLLDCYQQNHLASDVHCEFRGQLLDVIYHPQQIQQIANGISSGESRFAMTPERISQVQHTILNSLAYDGMDRRADAVTDAHVTTFHWVFEDTNGLEPDHPWASLRLWLESDSQMYWITGKAGSGKSTLMKYIFQPQASSDPPRCMEYLQLWANGQPLTIASFYFWLAGTEMQTLKDGLYRSLLHQILKAHPDLIEDAFPERWDALCLFNQYPRRLSVDDLAQALRRVVMLLVSKKGTKLCLSIDGLDEFVGKHDELITLLTQLTQDTDGQFLKLCVASRPWIVFEEAFRNKPSLRLQDLTFNDIKDYVASRFETEGCLSSLSTRGSGFASGLIEDVVRKSAGVFLWANLVVTSLIEGMKCGDRISDLQRRLDSLPPDLEDLYDRILGDLDPFYLEHAAQYFSLMEASDGVASMLAFSFADETEIEFSIRLPRDELWTVSELEARMDRMRRRLNSRCKGLLEMVQPSVQGSDSNDQDNGYDPAHARLFGSTVQYLHRTVKDYIQKPAVHHQLAQALKTPFDPRARLCSGNLGMFKVESKFS